METANTKFNEVYVAIDEAIPFLKEWSNGTGYHDHAVSGEHAPVLKYGQMVKAVTPGNRRLILVGTRLGNVVVFDRYVHQDVKNDGIIVHNASSAFDEGCWVDSGALTAGDLEVLLGDCKCQINIGTRIEHLHNNLQKSSEVTND